MPKRHTKKLTLGFILLVLLLALIWYFVQGPGRKHLEEWGILRPSGPSFAATDYKGDSSKFVYGGLPKGPAHLKILENKAFIVAYDEKTKNPAWVAYRIPGEVRFKDYERVDRFSVDERTDARVNHDDYTNSGFSRGQMAPSYAIYSRFGKEAQAETYLMSNVVPQRQDLKGGPWRSLEYKVAGDSPGDRCWAKTCGDIWVITGPYGLSRIKYTNLSNTFDVLVPWSFFKIVLDVDEETGGIHVLAFIMKNPRMREDRDLDLTDFLVSVDYIEELTGLDFFPDLEDKVEDALERPDATELWPVN